MKNDKVNDNIRLQHAESYPLTLFGCFSWFIAFREKNVITFETFVSFASMIDRKKEQTEMVEDKIQLLHIFNTRNYMKDKHLL